MAQKVLIGVPTGEFARQAVFYDYLNQIEKPENTLLLMTHGQSPAKGRNIIIEQALEHNCTHILFIDDDTCPPKDILTKLIAHDKDVVTGLYLMRNFPHQGVIFDESYSDGKCRWHSLSNSEYGLIPIVNCGFGAVLVKTHIFSRINPPYVTLGQCEKDQWCDDIDFFNKVRNAGFQLYCDTTVNVGHMGVITITPRFDGTKWLVDYDTNGISKVSFDAITLDHADEKN